MSATNETGSPARNVSRTLVRKSSRASSPCSEPLISTASDAVPRSCCRSPSRPGTASRASRRPSRLSIRSMRGTSQPSIIGRTITSCCSAATTPISSAHRPDHTLLPQKPPDPKPVRKWCQALATKPALVVVCRASERGQCELHRHDASLQRPRSAGASAVFTLLTLLWKDWIEIVFRVDPDGGSGWLEWAIAAAALAVALVSGALARRDRPRASSRPKS